MTTATMTVSGNVATPVRRETKKNGDPWCHFRLACNERRLDSRTNQWFNAQTSFFTVVCWRPYLARNVDASLNVGDPIVVHGKGRVQEWLKDSVLRTSIEIDATAIGHNLYWGTSSFAKVTRSEQSELDDEQIREAVVGYTSDDLNGVDAATGEIIAAARMEDVPPWAAGYADIASENGPAVIEADPEDDDDDGEELGGSDAGELARAGVPS